MEEQGEKGYVVKGDVEEVEEGMLRRMRVNARICCCGRKVADLKIYLFSATKQDRVGPSLQSRNTLFIFEACSTHCTVKLRSLILFIMVSKFTDNKLDLI